jgi:pyruvate/2-oxoacid:ferredoxin oxidoreductase beta subunit
MTADERTVQAMRVYGGSFIKSLAACFMWADEENYARLKAAFPDYWQKYSELGDLAEKREKEKQDAEKQTYGRKA